MTETYKVCVQSGAELDPFNPNKELIHFEDMALGLSNCCRYQGQGIFHYSVAQHSIYLAREFLRQMRNATSRQEELIYLEDAYCALLHDGSEAYLPDVPKPIKVRPEMAAYREAEGLVQAAIYEKFEVVGGESAAVKDLDRTIWGNEIPMLFPDGSVTCLHDLSIAGLVLERWSPERAYVEYTTLFHKVRRWTGRK